MLYYFTYSGISSPKNMTIFSEVVVEAVVVVVAVVVVAVVVVAVVVAGVFGLLGLVL